MDLKLVDLFKEARQVSTGYALAAFAVVAVIAIVALVLAPKMQIMQFGPAQTLTLIGMLLLTLLLLVILGPRKARPIGEDDFPLLLQRRGWTTKWYFGPKVYVEHLDLKLHGNHRVEGLRSTTTETETTTYHVGGWAIRGDPLARIPPGRWPWRRVYDSR